MKIYPKSSVRIERNPDGRFWFDDGRTGWVEVAVTVTDGAETVERSELFPIMDYKNNSIPAEKITSFNANTAIQRATTKAIARHGLGLYVYAGEDLPPEMADSSSETKKPEKQAETTSQMVTAGQLEALKKYAGNELLAKGLSAYNVTSVEQLTLEQASLILKAFAKKGM